MIFKHFLFRSGLMTRLAVCFAAGLLSAGPLQAQAFDPVIELFRLGADDMLVIDRSGPVSQAGDVNGDGHEDVILAVGIGSVRVVFGPTRGDNGRLSVGTLNGNTGFAINGDGPHASAAGDINNDGLDDVLVGSANGTYVIFGSRDGFPSAFDVATLNGTNGFKVQVDTSSVSEAGDVNGDGIDDIIIGSISADPVARNNAGISHIIFGRGGSFPATISPASLNGVNGYSLQGYFAGEESGYQVASAGDFNSDGLDDVLIGAPRADVSGEFEAGKAYLVYGTDQPNNGRVDLAMLTGEQMLIYEGNGVESFTGRSVSYVGDINRDGVPDIGIGAPGKGPFGAPSTYPGKVAVLFGGNFPAENQVVTENDLDGTRGFIMNGIRGGVIPVQDDQPRWGDMAGDSIDYAGDVNGDGVDDMIIGATQSIINPQRTGNGQVYLVYGRSGPFPRALDLADLDGQNGFRLNGIGTTDYTGFSVSRAGDFSNDGVDDVLIGAAGQGDAYLFYGRDTGAEADPVTSVGAPINLRAVLQSSTEVELQWDDHGLPIIRYDISRDGEFVASADGNANSYRDAGLTEDATVTYEVVAVSENGIASKPAAVSANLSEFNATPDPVVPVTNPDPETPVETPPVTTPEDGTPSDNPSSDPVPTDSPSVITTGSGSGSSSVWLLLLLCCVATRNCLRRRLC